jgi:CMP-N,N'-diacetyllegionaminic acid synthase
LNIISIIPARQNSQSIKNKNLAKLGNKPLIYYSIKQSLNCKQIHRTIVSTDSPHIASVAKKIGAEVPFLRPKKYSRNSSRDIEFLYHCLNWLKLNENYLPDLVVQLRPTQPLRSVSQIKKAIFLMTKDKNADSLRTISLPERSPYKMWIKRKKELIYFMKNLDQGEEFYNADRRKLPEVFWHDGAIDVIRCKTILNKSCTGKKMIYLENDYKYLVDIDEKKDLELANLLLKSKKIKLL